VDKESASSVASASAEGRTCNVSAIGVEVPYVTGGSPYTTEVYYVSLSTRVTTEGGAPPPLCSAPSLRPRGAACLLAVCSWRNASARPPSQPAREARSHVQSGNDLSSSPSRRSSPPKAGAIYGPDYLGEGRGGGEID